MIPSGSRSAARAFPLLAMAMIAAVVPGGVRSAAAQPVPAPTATTPTTPTTTRLPALARRSTVAAPAASRRGPVAGRTGPGPVLFFWSSASAADVEARPALLAAVAAAAAPRGARLLDLSPRPAAPADTAAHVARAVAAYDAMRFGEASAELDVAAASVVEHGAAGLSRDALVDLYLYRALSRIEAGDEAAAWNDFVRAATIDPSRILDPARFRPTAVKSFARAVQEVSARPPVALTIEAPAGSRILVDGRVVGRDRARETLQPGEHYLAVERPTAPAFARALTLASSTAITVAEDAARPPAEAELRRRALRLGAGSALVVAVSRQDGVGVVELRSLERAGAALRGAVRLGPSPAADAGDLRAAVDRALTELAAAPAGEVALVAPTPAAGSDRWYRSRWFWLAVGAAGALVAVTPFLLDSDQPPSVEATLPTDPLGP